MKSWLFQRPELPVGAKGVGGGDGRSLFLAVNDKGLTADFFGDIVAEGFEGNVALWFLEFFEQVVGKQAMSFIF